VAPPSAQVFQDISTRFERLKLDAEPKANLSLEVLDAALAWVQGGGGSPNDRVLGVMATERDLRFGLERSYRALAKLDPDVTRRVLLVDLANQIRPRTLV
jgi:serine/threonine-protein kinase PknG